MSRRKQKREAEAMSPPANIRVARNRGLARPTAMQWLAQHRAALRAAVAQLFAHRLGSLVNVLVIGLALALPLVLDHAVRNLGRVGGALDEQRDLTVFLDPALDAGDVAKAMSAIEAVSGVAAVQRRCSQRLLGSKPRWRSSSEKLVSRASGCSSRGAM